VRGSFRGDVAAHRLGDALLTWLWLSLPPHIDESALRDELTAGLSGVTGPLSEELAGLEQPPVTPTATRR
jgi:hypothetical protein